MNGVSVYIPQPIVTVDGQPTSTAQRQTFKPFSVPDAIENTPTYTFVTCNDGPSCASVTYDTTPMTVKYAGTYTVYLKVLPFCGVLMKNADGQNINIRDNIDIEVSGATIPEAEEALYTLSPTSVSFPYYNGDNANASESQYLDSKCAPSVSVNYKNVWKIDVTWKVHRDDEETDQIYSDTYYYTCTGVPLYYGDKVMSDSIVSDEF
jgi:hypothetical protein